MSKTKYEPQCFNGRSGEIKADLITPPGAGSKLAIVFPGAGYSCKQPLLYFGIQTLLRKGFQVLAIDKVYGDDPVWRKLSSEEEARGVVEQDAIALLADVSKRFPNGVHTLFGRSLGTYAIACVLARKLVEPKQIVWQTPALGNKWELMRSS